MIHKINHSVDYTQLNEPINQNSIKVLKVVQYGREPFLIQQILFDFEAILENILDVLCNLLEQSTSCEY